MKAYEFQTKGGKLIETQKPVPKPERGEIRVKVHACGICHSDIIAKNDLFGGGLPRVPGHEVAGVVDEVGEGVTRYKKGDRVGLGWFGKACGSCRNCDTHKSPANCGSLKATGIAFDGGYAEYCVAPADSWAAIPEGLSFAEAGPLMCAGVTTFNSLRHAGALPGDVVAVVGLGGLGHLGVQFANKMGFKTVAISRGSDKKELALKLGAHVYVDSSSEDPAKVLSSLGGAKVILYSATNASGVPPLLSGLDLGGRVLVVAALHDEVPVNTLALLVRNASISGWASGDARDSEDTLKFASLTGIKPMIEIFPFSKANEALDRMLTTQAKFRVVLEGWN